MDFVVFCPSDEYVVSKFAHDRLPKQLLVVGIIDFKRSYLKNPDPEVQLNIQTALRTRAARPVNHPPN